jgi:uncharacterized protein (TIGR00251 family)
LISLYESTQGVSFAVRVQPRSSRTGIRGLLGEGDTTTLKVGLAAPPLDGRANKELIEYFSALFHVAQFSVDVISGLQSRNKILRVTGPTAEQVRIVLNAALSRCS